MTSRVASHAAVVLVLAAFASCTACSGLDDAGLADSLDLVEGRPDARADGSAAHGDATEPDAATDVPLDAAEEVSLDGSFDGAPDAVDAATDTRDAPDAAPPFCDPVEPTLVGCYRFEVATHPAQPWDESAYANHGTATSATFVDGPLGKAVSIGPATLLKVPDSASLAATNALTIELWVRVRTLPATGRAGLVDHDGRYGLFLLPGGVVRATSPTPLDTGPVLPVGKWVHVAYTYDGTTETLWIAGKSVTSLTAAGGTFGTGSGAGLAIGANSPSGDNLDGEIDALRIWRAARTASQICAAAGGC